MMIYDDVRRCRRCKRRRMDDEPPEVQQYKTCAKCRIIERTKKKLRKPLAEETMRYGMRQFQEQNQSTDFMGDDIFPNDPYGHDMDSTPGDSAVGSPQQGYAQYPYNKAPEGLGSGPGPYGGPNLATGASGSGSDYGYSYNNTPLYLMPRSTTASSSMRPINGNRVASGATGPDLGSPYQNLPPPHPASANPAHLVNSASSIAPGSSGTGTSSGKSRQDYSAPAKSLSRHYKDKYKTYLQKKTPDRTRSLPLSFCELCASPVNPESNVSSIYRLCGDCFADPYSKPHVYKDFNEFLLKAVHDTKFSSYTYISEIPAATVESILVNRPINSEEQFRKVLLETFGLIFIDPLLALLAPLKFSRFSQNFGDVNNTLPVILRYSRQLHYQFTMPLRAAYGVTSDAEKTRVDMVFVPETNVMILKKKTQTVAPTYSALFLKQMDEQWKSAGLDFSAAPLEVYPHLTVNISRELFIRDFSALVSQIKTMRATDKTLNALNKRLIGEATNGVAKKGNDMKTEVEA